MNKKINHKLRAGKCKIHDGILNFLTLYFLVNKMNEWEFQKKNSVVRYPIFNLISFKSCKAMLEADLQSQHIFCNQMMQTFFLHVPTKN